MPCAHLERAHAERVDVGGGRAGEHGAHFERRVHRVRVVRARRVRAVRLRRRREAARYSHTKELAMLVMLAE